MTFLLFIIVPMLLGMWAQMRVQSTYKKFAQVGARSRITGREAALYVMQKAGIHDVEITSTPGHLTDHYDPTRKRLVLSEENYNGSSLAALGVAAHEAGHAIQHNVGYSMLRLRMALVPITNISSQMLPFVMIGGFIFGMLGLVKLGVLVYIVLTIFQLVTLPVEFDASRRAKAELVSLGMIDSEERRGVDSTLDAAAWTYVAAFVASLGNLLYLLAILNGRRD